MKILIAGNDLNAVIFAEYIKIRNKEADIYITGEDACSTEMYTVIGIKDNDVPALRDFAKYNHIDFTIGLSPLAVINGIADEFTKENLPVSAPFSEAARAVFFNSTAKKIMYKLKINTPRFGIFDRENTAADYIRNSKFPIVIMNDFTLNERINAVYPCYSKARAALQKIFENRNEKVIIENYIDEEPVYMYFLTDGYNAVHLISLERKEGEGFTEIKAPPGKITVQMTENIMNRAVFPFLDDTMEYAGCYSGILGLKVKIQNGSFYVLEYYNNFQSYDLQTFLSLSDEDLIELFKQTAFKQLETRSRIELDSKYSYTLAVKKTAEIQNADEDDFITEDKEKIIITQTAASMNYAKQNCLEKIEAVCDKEVFEHIKQETENRLRVSF